MRIHRKLWLPALLLLASAVPTPPAYTRLKLFELAAFADVIVAGRILDVGAKTFKVSVEELVVGAGSNLRVQRFVDWTCHHRWTEYAKGQRLLLFLRHDPEKPGTLSILGAGDEGELPFVDEHVVVENTHGYRVRGHDVANLRAAGAEILGTRVSFRELADAIRGFRAACSWDPWEAWGPTWRIGPRGDDQQFHDYASTSVLARHLADEARTSGQWTGREEDEAVSIDESSLRRITELAHDDAGRAHVRKRKSLGFSTWFSSTAFLGDVDGDGMTDLAVGARREDNGTVWLLFLNENGRVRASIEIRPQLAAPMNEFTGFGTALAPLGDLDGDGIPDLAASGPGWDGAGSRQGGLWIFFLKRDGSVAREVELGSSKTLQEAGVRRGSGIGASLANLGDLDGDGMPELAIGQDEDRRSVWIASIGSNGTAQRARRIDRRRDGFASDSSWFGDALASVGDVDGDGTPDMAIADTYDHEGGELRGAVWIVFLERDASIKRKQKISDWSGGFEGWLTDYAQFGQSLVGPGDLDGDGVPDLLAGSTDALWTLLLNRDGTVRSHRRVVLRDTDTEALTMATSLSSSPALGSDARLLLAVSGTLAKSKGSRRVVWWLTAGEDGRLGAW